MATYSRSFKERMVQRLTLPNAINITELSKEVNVCRGTLYRWVTELQNAGEDTMAKKTKRPQERHLAERLELIVNAGKLSGENYGAFLRKEGLTTATIEKWKAEFISTPVSQIGHPTIDEFNSLKKENIALGRDLLKKDKALAEVSALLILKKKANLIWGVEEE